MISQAPPLSTVPLRHEAHRLAKQFATEQVTPQKGKQVYLNTLAVYAVHSWLKLLQIETDLGQGDSWHLGKRAFLDVADLVLPGIGRLECRPILPGETIFSLPLEVTDDRIGYVAVRISESLDEARLLGFVRAIDTKSPSNIQTNVGRGSKEARKQMKNFSPSHISLPPHPPSIANVTFDVSNASEEIQIADLQPLDVLLDCIPANSVGKEPVLTASKMQAKLSRWLQNNFEAGWQTVEALLRTEVTSPAFRVRSAELLRGIDADDSVVSVSAGKLINWGMQLAGYPVALIVKVVPKAEEEVSIRLRVYPAGEQVYLPSGLQLILADESRATCLEAQARSADSWIQIELSGYPEERFSVKVALGNMSITEDFVI